MRYGWVGIVFLSLLLVGCRQEDWKETSFEVPANVNQKVLISALRALDRETPPEVRIEQGMAHVRYNSMRLAVRNLTYVRDELAAKQELSK